MAYKRKEREGENDIDETIRLIDDLSEDGAGFCVLLWGLTARQMGRVVSTYGCKRQAPMGVLFYNYVIPCNCQILTVDFWVYNLLIEAYNFMWNC